MATKNLSDHIKTEIPLAKGMKFGIVVAEWNHEITNMLKEGAVKTLKKNGVLEEDICVRYVPGSFELPLGGQFFAEYRNPDAVILLGCVIQGETRHFDFICQGVTKGAVDLSLKYNIPFIFGVLTTSTYEQAKARAGGILGNKGDEAAISAIKMVSLKNEMKK